MRSKDPTKYSMIGLSIDKEQAIPSGTALNAFVYTYLLFMIMGSGANWVLSTALALEIPYFQNNQPEGLCIATYMNAANAFGVISMLAYVYINQHMNIPYIYSVPSLLVVTAFGSFLASAVYGITAGGASYMLYICCAIGGSVGALSSVIMNPFMTGYENSYISAGRSGGSALILITALLALAQNPGSSNPRFSVTAYLCIIGALMCFPLLAYRIIIQKQLGLRRKQINDVDVEMRAQDAGTGKVSAVSNNPLVLHDEDTTDSYKHMPDIIPSSASTAAEQAQMNAMAPRSASMRKLVLILVSDSMHQRMPWLRDTLPYCMTVGWVNFNTWGIVTAMTPFAMDHASPGNGSLNLSIAYQLGAFLLVSGDLSTTWFKLPFAPCLLCFSVFCFTIYSAALGGPGFNNAVSAPLLIMIFALERFVEAHLVTSAYRVVATQLPLRYRQDASRAVGVCDQLSTTVGALLSTLVVSLLFSCGD